MVQSNTINLTPKNNFLYNVFVGLGDTNMDGNVYWASYFVWLGKAREVFLMHLCQNFLELFAAGMRLLTHETHIKHFSYSYFADEITMEISTGEVRNTSVKIFVDFIRKSTGVKVAEGWQSIVCADHEGKPSRFPPELKKAILQYVK